MRGRLAVPPRGRGTKLASRPRVLMTGVPMVHGAERVLEIVESGGGLVVVAWRIAPALKPILEDVDAAAADPLRAHGREVFPSALLGDDAATSGGWTCSPNGRRPIARSASWNWCGRPA